MCGLEEKSEKIPPVRKWENEECTYSTVGTVFQITYSNNI